MVGFFEGVWVEKLVFMRRALGKTLGLDEVRLRKSDEGTVLMLCRYSDREYNGELFFLLNFWRTRDIESIDKESVMLSKQIQVVL